MGVNDEQEKRRQALDWILNGTPDQKEAAREYLDEQMSGWCSMHQDGEDPECAICYNWETGK